MVMTGNRHDIFFYRKQYLIYRQLEEHSVRMGVLPSYWDKENGRAGVLVGGPYPFKPYPTMTGGLVH